MNTQSHSVAVNVIESAQISSNSVPLFYRREAVQNPSRVTLRPHMQTAVLAAGTRTWTEADTVERPKPHFRTSAPGIKAMLAANFLLLYICFTVKV